jgi:2-polyprenyl-3-methyl-5-hydroxy-6-metoxy-1,4-benzoquinol methylase
MNHCDQRTTAKRYSRERPDFHENAIEHIKSFLQIEDKFNKALDIACGTGLLNQSAVKNRYRCLWTDISQEMLNFATYTDKIKSALAISRAATVSGQYF